MTSGGTPAHRGHAFEPRRTVEAFGVRFDDLTLDETLDQVDAFVTCGCPHRHVAVNVDILVLARRSPALLESINAADLVSCDGVPIHRACRWLGTPIRARVAGVDLFEALLNRAAAKGFPVYFLGAREEVVREVGRRAASRFPALRIAGRRNGYWQASDEAAVVREVRAAAPALLFLAIPSPRKEEFLHRHLAALAVPFVMGVGGSFDVFAGVVSRAPAWMQQAGLEWFHRFLQEPGRMFGRYFVRDAYFLKLIADEAFRRRSPRSRPGDPG